MMPEECASIRSIAKWVLPVLVGPSTAVTPAPGARSLPNEGGEKAIFCRCFLRRYVHAYSAKVGTGFAIRIRVLPRLCFNLRRRCGRGLSSGTSLERNAPESLTPAQTRFVHRNISRGYDPGDTRSSLRGLHKPGVLGEFLKVWVRSESNQKW